MIAYIDTETVGGVDLKNHTIPQYLTDCRLDILAIAFKDAPSEVYDCAKDAEFKRAKERLIALADEPDPAFCFHNAGFDVRVISQCMGLDARFWAKLNIYCSMAMCRWFNFPASLDKAGHYLLGRGKDQAGYHLIKKTASNPQMQLLHSANRDKILNYCRQDAELCRDISKVFNFGYHMHHPPKGESVDDADLFYVWWRNDQKINSWGAPVDAEMIDTVVRLVERRKAEANTVAKRIAGTPATRRAQILDFAVTQQGGTAKIKEGPGRISVENILYAIHTSRLKDERADALMQAVKDANLSSTAKWEAAQKRVHEGRIHDNLVFHGAANGRYTSFGVQFHNFPRVTSPPRLESVEDWTMEECSKNLRCMVQAPEGRTFVVADYRQIELRLLLFMAGEMDMLHAISEGADPYRALAADIFGKNEEKITKEERVVGKSAMLGLGYGMGIGAFCKYARVKEDIGTKAYNTYHSKLPRVKMLWDMLERGQPLFENNQSSGWGFTNMGAMGGKRSMCLRLPTGRAVRFWVTDIAEKREGFKAQVMGKPAEEWYGSKLCEYLICGTAADILARALNKCMTNKMMKLAPVLHIHDEIVVETKRENAEFAQEVLVKCMESAPGKEVCALPVESRITDNWGV